MFKASTLGFGLVIFARTLLMPAVTSAQMAPSPSSPVRPGMPTGPVMANPYLNPYFNPYMNPMATQQPMSANNALLYLYAANVANGGVGSGRISGTRGSTSRARPSEMPNSSANPGGGAARFFNPGTGGGNAGRYYNQRGRYFQNNGR